VGGGTATGTVTLSAAAPAGGSVVQLRSSNTALATVPTSVTVAAGARTAVFTVTTAGTRRNRSVSIVATLGTRSVSATLDIRAR
jgi:hypothetical protein